MVNKDMLWFEGQCRNAFGLKQEAHLRWTCDCSRVNLEEFVCCQVRANETYSEAQRMLSVRNRDVLMNDQSSQKWWSILIKSAVFGLSSSLPPLVGGGGGLLCELVCKADIVTGYFDGKQFRESVDLPFICRMSPRRTTFAFRSSEVRSLFARLGPLLGH